MRAGLVRKVRPGTEGPCRGEHCSSPGFALSCSGSASHAIPPPQILSAPYVTQQPAAASCPSWGCSSAAGGEGLKISHSTACVRAAQHPASSCSRSWPPFPSYPQPLPHLCTSKGLCLSSGQELPHEEDAAGHKTQESTQALAEGSSRRNYIISQLLSLVFCGMGQ